jgi:hypothetical protein
MRDRGEIYTSLSIEDARRIDNPFFLPGFDRIDGDSIFLYLRKEHSSFLKRNSDVLQIVPPPSLRTRVKMTGSREEVLQGNAYPTYPLYLEIMKYFRDSFPEICHIDTIGYSSQGRSIIAARLAREGLDPGDVPVVFLTATIHGDETAGYVFMLMLIDYFLAKSNAETETILDNLIVIINPLSNPDGTYHTGDSTIFGATRGNANGVDLNRNFPDPETGNHPDGNVWQAETKAMMSYMDEIRPSLSANFHGGAEVVNYPFDTWAARHADEDWFRLISLEYASLARSLQAGYMENFSKGITHGYSWYEVDGGRQDYTTYFLRGRETTIELSNKKIYPEAQLSGLWDVNRASLLNYIKQALYGFHGIVKDSLSKEIVSAELRIRDHDKLNSSVFTHPETGKFFRFIKGGNYNLEFFADGYRVRRINNIKIRDYENINLEVSLIPDGMLPGETFITIGPNPFYKSFRIFLELEEPADAGFKIFDLYGNLLYHSVVNFPAGYHEYSIEPAFSPGMYLLRVQTGSEMQEFKIIKTD